jgi:hypothetical protein
MLKIVLKNLRYVTGDRHLKWGIISFWILPFRCTDNLFGEVKSLDGSHRRYRRSQLERKLIKVSIFNKQFNFSFSSLSFWCCRWNRWNDKIGWWVSLSLACRVFLRVPMRLNEMELMKKLFSFLLEIAAPTTTLTTELTLFNKSKWTNETNVRMTCKKFADILNE